MRYSVTHMTRLEYAAPVRLAQFNVRLRPAAWPGQTVSDYQLSVDPQPARVFKADGGYHVNEARFSLHKPISQLQIESRFTVEREDLPFFMGEADGPGLTDLRELAMRTPDLSALAPASYIFASPIAVPEHDIALWAGSFLDESMPVMEAGRTLMQAIHDEFAYDAKATATDTPPIDAFRRRHGVCQDFSHVMIIAARAHGIPAAYVSGWSEPMPCTPG